MSKACALQLRGGAALLEFLHHVHLVGVFARGMSMSMRKMKAMPAKKASTTLNAGRAAPPAATCSNACGNSSTNDTYTMTPAENPSAVERNLMLVRRAKKAMALPMPVLSPASRVSTRAKRNGKT